MILYTASHIALGVLCKEPTLESVLADFNRKHLEIDKVRVTHDYILVSMINFEYDYFWEYSTHHERVIIGINF